MSTKALKTQLLAAVAMVLVASVALGSSTYAWFASNNKVDATGIKITAKADTTYLLISSDKNIADDIQAQGKIQVDLNSNVELYPAALKTDTTNPYNDADDNWWYANAAAMNSATKKDDTVVTFGETTVKAGTADKIFDERVLKQTVWLTLTDGSMPSGKLMVNGESFTDGIGGATKIVVCTASKAVTITAENASNLQELAGAGGVTSADVTEVRIFVYFDGENQNIRTDNMANLSTATAALRFTLADA